MRASLLLVDSDPVRGELALAALQARGFDVRLVAEARDARAALGRCAFDAVLVADAAPVDILEKLRLVLTAPVAVLQRAPDWLTCVELTTLGAADVLPPQVPYDEIAARLKRLLPPRGAAA
jgi:DNA-binding response OmpR family regulator